MELEINNKVAGFTLEPAMMFTYPSRIASLYAPQVERVFLPEKHVPDLDVSVQIKTGNTGLSQDRTLKQKISTTFTKRLGKSISHNMADYFIFDARFDTDKNLAHVVDNIMLPVLYAQRVLSEKLNKEIKIHVILKKGASPLAKEAYDVVGIPTICTDGNVYGNIVTVSTHEMFGAIPEVFDVKIKNFNPDTPERVFIPRRGNRRLINNEEVVNFLEKKGFVTYYFEDLTPSEEWSITRNAKVMIALHGAACSHLAFNQVGLQKSSSPGSGVRIIEIFSPCFVLSAKRHLATLLNGKWCAVRGQITPQALRELDFNERASSLSPLVSPVKDPFRVDLESLQMALEHLEIS
jgi:hypothetical protein